MIPIRRVVALLLALQVVSTVYLWTGNAVGIVSDARFAVFLAVNLLSFSTVAYVFTREKWGEVLTRRWIIASSLAFILLFLSSLYFH